MRTWRTLLLRFLTVEEGPTAVEYAVMLALIISVCVAAIKTLGTNTNTALANPTLQTALTVSGSSSS